MDKALWKTSRIGLAALLLLGGGLFLNSCESDPVAVQEALPEPTEQEAAQQAALVAVSVAKVGPKLVTFTGPPRANKDLGIYPYTFPSGGDITGTIMLEFFTGGSTGTHSAWGDADYGLLYSPQGEMVTASLDLGGGIGPIFGVGFNLFGDINQVSDTATVSGKGVFVTGDINHPFSLTDVDLDAVSSYPHGGMVSVMAGELEVIVAYDGSHLGGMSINGTVLFIVDLDTGIIYPVVK